MSVETYEPNPEAIPRVRKNHLRALEKRRDYLVAREADPKTPTKALSYVREERTALDVALGELGELYTARLEGRS